MQNDDPIEAVTSSMTLVEGKALQLYASNVPTERQNFVIPMIRGFQKDTDFIVKKFCALLKQIPLILKLGGATPLLINILRREKDLSMSLAIMQKGLSWPSNPKKVYWILKDFILAKLWLAIWTTFPWIGLSLCRKMRC